MVKASKPSQFSKMNTAMSEFLFDQVAMTHRFIVQIDKSEYDLGSWSSVSGLSISWKKIEYRPGESNDDIVLPGNSSVTNIKLERAVCSDSEIVKQWLTETSRNRKFYSGCVSILDYLGDPLIDWHMNQFFPISWKIGDFNSKSASPAIETLELAHTGFLDDAAQAGRKA